MPAKRELTAAGIGASTIGSAAARLARDGGRLQAARVRAAMTCFRDRAEAGRKLAGRLSELGLASPVVLGLPRGGIPVAAEVAAALRAPFDVFVARKISAPGQDELGIGAVAEGLQEPVITATAAELGIRPPGLQGQVQQAWAELRRRATLYRAGRPLPNIEGNDVVVIDDGLATGVTAEAALQAIRQLHPSRLVLAVPVCAPQAGRPLTAIADDIICLHSPPGFMAVSEWYDDFPQTTDEEVLSLLWHRQRA